MKRLQRQLRDLRVELQEAERKEQEQSRKRKAAVSLMESRVVGGAQRGSGRGTEGHLGKGKMMLIRNSTLLANQCADNA